MSCSSKRILLTGASGFLGTEIGRLAGNAGWRLRTFDRNPKPRGNGAETFVGDIGDTAMLRKAADGVDAIIHAAGRAHVFGTGAKDSAAFKAVNETGTANIADVALESGVPHVVLVSSVSVYGGYGEGLRDEFVTCDPKGLYAISKWRAERAAIDRIANSNCSLTILRFATIYGEGDRGNVAKLINALDRGYFVWPGSGENQKSLIYKEDAARACLLALERSGHTSEIFNVAARPSRMSDIVEAICRALRRPIPRLRIPLPFFRAAGAISRVIGDPGDLDHRFRKFIQDDVYDGTRFEKAFGFLPAVSIEEGIRRQVDSRWSGVPAPRPEHEIGPG